MLRQALSWLKTKVVEKTQRLILTVLASGPIPKHVAFIMDGNRRYARSRQQVVWEGHKEGFLVLRKMLEICFHLNIKCVSVFAFAIDNFKRPEDEVQALMSMAEEKLVQLCANGELLDRHGVRLNVVGNVSLLPESVQKAVRKAENMTSHNKSLIFNLCMPYSSQHEITMAVQSCVQNSINNPDDTRIITEDDIDSQLMTSLGGSPPVDVMVRTSGVTRFSDYLLWQASPALLSCYASLSAQDMETPGRLLIVQLYPICIIYRNTHRNGQFFLVVLQREVTMEKAKQLYSEKKYNAALPHVMAAIKEDLDYADDVVSLVFESKPQEVEGAILVARAAEHAARMVMKRRFGENCFDDSNSNVGHFWSLLTPRPYVRVLGQLSRLFFVAGNYKECEKTMIEMLRLCNSDNMGRRQSLGSVLIRNGRYSEALYFAEVWLKSSKEGGEAPPRGGTNFNAPSNRCVIGEVSGYEDGSLLHTAALAAFKLHGDCQQSRQYLEAAVKTQPYVLLKVLASVSSPRKLNMSVRTYNGPEEAQDYLWFTQDLWMEPDVWNWANGNPYVVDALLQDCKRGECPLREVKVAQFKRCAACHTDES
ncbi:hypothetical protein H0H92_011596 [Tricholoma furcatifolium]|nr:hypothetical protein H0H92_011596 [Tricholoma furcatifolium]